MGLNLNSIKLFFEAKAAGVCFEKTLTLGRQSFHCHPVFFHELKAKYGYAEAGWASDDAGAPAFAEPFFRLLGAREIVALDHSSYEGATLVHDMNVPIAPELAGRFDTVIDGGALEHIFNFPTAIKNCMDLVRVGGHLLVSTPINNYCGHGFYQFSPELFFRILSPENGYCIERAIAWEEYGHPEFFAVEDPAAIRQRVEMVNRCPVLMFVQAKKLRPVPAIVGPQQSDYVTLWEQRQGSSGAGAAAPGTPATLKARLFRVLRDRFPHSANTLFSVWRRQKLKALSMGHGPGFRGLGRLSSRRASDRLAP